MQNFFYNLDEPNKSKETLESMLAHANNSVDTENPGVPNNAFDALFAAGAEFVDFDVPDRSDEKEEFNRDAALFAIKTIKKLIQKPEWADYLTWAKEPIAKTPQGEICQNETIDAKEKDEAVAVEMVNLFKQSKAAIDAETDEEPAPKFTGLLAN